MLRPATPLAILLLAAFVLLLLSVLSTPIIQSIPLASFGGTSYGVFGFCSGSSCSGIKVGYGTALTGDSSSDFSLPAPARTSLSDILIVHPVAAFLTLICLVLAVLSHFHTAAHSSRYLLGLIILMLPTLLLSLLAFLVDVLLFAPHLAWGSWIVLAATIVIVISGILTCAMRRTIVSRKARKKRIAENAEMSGENFYNRQNIAPVASPPPLSQEPRAPMVNGSPGANNLPSFATFEHKSPVSEDDRTPLNRTGTAVSGSTTIRPSMEQDGMDRYGMGAGRGNMPPSRGRGGPMGGPTYDDGSPFPSSATLSSGPGGQYPQRRPSNETMNSAGSRGRGRGGYPPRGYGRGGPYNMRGGPGGRGGMPMGAMAAGAGVGMMAGEMMGRGRGPPPGYSNPYGPQPPGRQGPPPNPYNPGYGGPGPYARRSPGPPSTPGNGRQPSPGPPSAPGYGRQPSPGPPSAPGVYGGGYGRGRADSPPPLPLNQSQRPGHDPNAIGQAVEMNEHTGSPANPSTPSFPPPDGGLRDSDSEVQGLVGLQQNRNAEQHDSHVSSVYSAQQDYVPPRAAWGDGSARAATPPRTTTTPVADRRSPPQIHTSGAPAPSRAQVSSDNYYEDVDPRFTDQAPQQNIPTVLIPGGSKDDPYPPESQAPPLQTATSYDSVQDGPLSEASNFTSISERGVNPQWQAEHQGYGIGGVPNRGPPPRQQRDFLLANNPDFELPAGRGGRGPGRGGQGAMPMGGMI